MITFDKKTGMPNLHGELSDGELADARAIAVMMRSKGWKALEKYFEIGEESIVDAIANKSTDLNYKEQVPQWGAVLKGWRRCFHWPEIVVARAEEHLKEEVQDADEI